MVFYTRNFCWNTKVDIEIWNEDILIMISFIIKV